MPSRLILPTAGRTLVTALLVAVHFSTWAIAQSDEPQPEKDSSPPVAAAERDFSRLIAKIRPSVVTIKVSGRDGDQLGMGTGFVIDSEGLIATNFHVINEGRPFTVELPSGRQLPVLAIEASDRNRDLAIVRVDPGSQPLQTLPIKTEIPAQGTRVLAFGNPLGLRDSVVAGIVSAVREMDQGKMIQLAMPTQPGNSGGPVVELGGAVVGIVNMKSAVDDNLGFAIPVGELKPLQQRPNPVAIDRWVRLGQLDPSRWKPLMGANWQQRGGVITAQGPGNGFGGRSLCLRQQAEFTSPMQIAVQVKLDDESGAAGLAFHSDGEDRHYGFYPSNGRLRLTCFKGPSVFTWQVLQEVDSEHYVPGQWNHLCVRLANDKLQCFLNGHLVIESDDHQLSTGKFGLVKFRDTVPEFKAFQFGERLEMPRLSETLQKTLQQLLDDPNQLPEISTETLAELGQARGAVSRQITRKQQQLQQQVEALGRLSQDIQIAPTLRGLQQSLKREEQPTAAKVFAAALWVAKLDHPDLPTDHYHRRVETMAKEIRKQVKSEAPEDGSANAKARRDAMHRYLFKENGYHGGRAEYYHPANSHLHRVIDDREGLPITLSILYMELGRQLDLEIEGIGLPGHFVVRDVTDGQKLLIDVFNEGETLSREDAAGLVAMHTGRRLTDRDLKSQTATEIIARVLSNLIGVAGREQDPEAIHRYCEALVTVQPEAIDARRMRAQIRAITGRTDAALEDLDWILNHASAAVHHREAMQMRQALTEQR